MADETVFLTDERRDVLNGEYDGVDSTKRAHKTNIRNRARTALDELIKVADSPAIDNDDVFDTEQVYTLIAILLRGRGGLIHGDDEEAPTAKEVRRGVDHHKWSAWKPKENYANELYIKIDAGLRSFHAEDDDRTPRSFD